VQIVGICMRRGCTYCYREVYELCQPGFRGRCTAPLVVDRHQRRLVSNESSDIVRMLNSFQVRSMARLGVPPSPLSPAGLRAKAGQNMLSHHHSFILSDAPYLRRHHLLVGAYRFFISTHHLCFLLPAELNSACISRLICCLHAAAARHHQRCGPGATAAAAADRPAQRSDIQPG
jgi:hypothetical protein